MKKINNENGITLIILIITIVVLLILSGITISMITGGDGVIDKASNASEQHIISEEKENIEILKINAMNKSKFGDLEKDLFQAELDNKYGSGDCSLDGLHFPYILSIKSNGRSYIVKENEIVQITDDFKNIYATLYDDGTLAFSKYKNPIKEKTVLKQFDENVYDKTYSWSGNDIAPWVKNEYNNTIKTIKFVDEIMPIKTCFWFYNLVKLEKIDNIENLITNKVTSTKGMFWNCLLLSNLNLSSFNTEKVTDMSDMFDNCKKLEILDLSSFDTSNVKTFHRMFYYCEKLKKINFSSFNTSNVTSMHQMFSSCYSLETLDLSSFDTNKVTDMAGIFYYDTKLTKIYIGENWNTDKFTDSSVFGNCPATLVRK